MDKVTGSMKEKHQRINVTFLPQSVEKKHGVKIADQCVQGKE
jgi:hypothetical protein